MFKTIANIFLSYPNRYLIDGDVFFFEDIENQEMFNKLLGKLELNKVKIPRHYNELTLAELKEKEHNYILISEKYYGSFVVYSYSHLDNLNDLQRINVKKYLGITK